MRNLVIKLVLAAIAITPITDAAPAPVISTHPRLLLTTAEKSRLLARVTANDPSWQALKARTPKPPPA